MSFYPSQSTVLYQTYLSLRMTDSASAMMFLANLAPPCITNFLPFLNSQLASTRCKESASSRDLTSRVYVLSLSINFIIMLRLTYQLTRSFSQAKIPLQLSYPFEHTLNSQQFAFMDIRFTQIPFSRELWPPQRQHICLVLKSFEERLNNNRQQGEMDKFITKRLKDRAEQLKDIAKEAQFQLRFSLDEKSVVKSTGYYEIKPEAGLSLDEKVIEEIHNYKFSRNNEVLTVSMKEKKAQLNSQEQLKKDMLDKMGGEQSREIKEQFEKMSVSKHAVVYNQLIEKFLSIGKKEKKNTKFQPYYIVDQIKGQFSCQMHHQGSVYNDEAIEFDSKWLYYVTNLQSNDLKKYRRRTLFDFQYWSRGSFFPIRNFASEVIRQ